MPESNMSTAFMVIKSWMRTAASEFGIPLSSREAHRVTNVYVSTLRGDEYSTITYSDPTGEAACRRWLAAQMRAAA